jgi:hypothetical protein
MPYYEFNQNNSGGDFEIDGDVSLYVWIEADTAREANDKAEQVGIYFDGVNNNKDCGCCGDRWLPAVESEAEEFPRISNHGSRWVGDGESHTIIYHADGTVDRLTKEVIQINERGVF